MDVALLRRNMVYSARKNILSGEVNSRPRWKWWWEISAKISPINWGSYLIFLSYIGGKFTVEWMKIDFCFAQLIHILYKVWAKKYRKQNSINPFTALYLSFPLSFPIRTYLLPKMYKVAAAAEPYSALRIESFKKIFST